MHLRSTEGLGSRTIGVNHCGQSKPTFLPELLDE